MNDYDHNVQSIMLKQLLEEKFKGEFFRPRKYIEKEFTDKMHLTFMFASPIVKNYSPIGHEQEWDDITNHLS